MATIVNPPAEAAIERSSAGQASQPEKHVSYASLWREIKRLAPQAQLLRGPANLSPLEPSSQAGDLDILVPDGIVSVRAFLEEQGFYRVFDPRAYVERFQLPVAEIPEPYAVDLFVAERWGAGFRLSKRYQSRRTTYLLKLVHAIVDGKGRACLEVLRTSVADKQENGRIPRFGSVGRALLRIGNTKLLTLYLLVIGVIRPDFDMLVRHVYRWTSYRTKQVFGKQGLEIALLGVDGTGKTSLATALLRSPVPVKVIYMGADHDHRTRLMQFIHERSEWLRKPCYRYEMLIRRMSGWVAAKRGWIVIYDRHPAELLVPPNGSLKNVVKHFIDRWHAWHVDFTFWLTGNYSVIYERKREQSEEQLRAFDLQYQAMLQHTGAHFKTIDVTKNNFSAVLAHITERILLEVRNRSLFGAASVARKNSSAAAEMIAPMDSASFVSPHPPKRAPFESVTEFHAAGKGFRYLTPSEYPLWDALVDASPQGSVFCTSWYLSALGASVRVLGYFEGDRLVAGIPLHYDRRIGFKLCCMPKLTPVWGVIMEPLSGKEVTIAARELEILSIFAERLSDERGFVQAFHPSLQNWLPFRWKGFRQTSRFTYVIDDLRDTSRIWDEMTDSCRRQIRKAEKHSIQVQPCDSNVVLAAIQKTFQRQKIALPYPAHYFSAVCDAAIQHDAAQCFAAQDESGSAHAAACLIWDKKRAYYFAGGGDPMLRNSGATSLLMWHLIRFSASRSAVFDFEGSDLEPIERFFRGFGAKQQAYNYITKFPRWMAASLALAGKI